MEEKRPASAGEQFVKRLRPAGCILFLAITVFTVIFCFSSKGLPVKGYSAPETSEYYAQRPEELEKELEDNLIPLLDGVLSCETEDGKVRIEFDGDKIAAARSHILYYYDSDLFNFVKIENSGE